LTRVIERIVGTAGVGQRLDKFLAVEIPDRSRSQIQDLIKTGQVTVGGAPAKPSYRLTVGDVVIAKVSPGTEAELVPEPMSLDIVYQDPDLLVINKPAGIVVHPAPGHSSGTLVNALLAQFPSLAELAEEEGAPDLRPGVVHRLDKDTSGLILIARRPEVRRYLQRLFKQRQVEKTYLALVEGHVQPPDGIIDAPIGRDPRHRQRMAVVREGGRPAQTVYRLIEYLDDCSLLSIEPVTGRTHQIRVHLAAVGHPVVGDLKYGYRRQRHGLDRQFLHAWKLRLKLPSGELREFVAQPPEDLRQVLIALAGEVPAPVR
jgi:23S rRNA pseudouridine1911/1915/1917 synthase